MPTYDYRCPEGHTFEKFQKITSDPVASCPECGAVGERLISGGAGLVFKGSGFYITDYGKDGKGPRTPAKDDAGKAPSDAGAKGKDGSGSSTSGSSASAPPSDSSTSSSGD